MSKPVILHTEVSNGWGGQEIRILNEMLGIKGRGYNVMLATPSDTAIFKRANDAGIETFAVRMDRAGFLGGVIRLASIIRDNDVSIINTHSSRDSWIGSIAGRLTGCRVIRTRHISSKLNTSPLTRLVYGRLCDAVITTGEFIKKQLSEELKLAPDKIYSIPTGIDPETFDNADGGRLRRELGLGSAEVILGTAAVLRSWKGHEFLVKAMPAIVGRFPEARLVLAGEGPVRPYIERWMDEYGLEGKVFLLGHREDIADVVKSFDISLLVSYASEGVPQFLLQSMAAGKPVVGSTTGGIPEVVEDGVTGLLVPPRDPDAIADAVTRLLSSSETLTEMGMRGREKVVAGFSYEGMLDSLEKLYGKVLGSTQ